MKNINFTLLALLIIIPNLALTKSNSLLSFETNRLGSSEKVNFTKSYKGKVLLVVNTASQCGFTSQFSGLEKLYKKYKEQGLEIVGFPSNDFFQEHKEADKTATVCYQNYGVTFNVVTASSVKGDKANSFFKELIKQSGKAPSWNFNKYLIDRQGNVVEHFGSGAKPLDGDLEKSIIALLN